jgi:hypothetical protein
VKKFRIYKKHLILLAMMCLAFVCQLRAQFEDDFDDDGGPGGFDPPPDSDVPLDTYQWVMMGAAILYGLYIYIKHAKKTQKTNIKNSQSPAMA